MDLRGRRSSRNIEDRRRSGGRRGVGRGGATGGVGLVGVLAILAIGYFTGIDVTGLLTSQPSAPAGQPRQVSAEDEQAAVFVSQVLGTTEDVWTQIFETELGRSYTPPVLVLFSGVTQSPCGGASGATGPFYCPADKKAYLDTDFFVTLSHQLGAHGDFAAAYVVAHEVAHHVQNELGILPKVHQARLQSSKADANALTVRLELQADCLSGVWARYVENLLERGDLEEAINAARMIGDDKLQRDAGRTPQPHTFTHGTSAQRARWFDTGFDSGRIGACDTFNARTL